MERIPDIYDVLDEYQRQEEIEEEKYLASLPDCEWCGEKIHDDYYDIGEIVCEECMEKCKRGV